MMSGRDGEGASAVVTARASDNEASDERASARAVAAAVIGRVARASVASAWTARRARRLRLGCGRTPASALVISLTNNMPC
jgi:hypothetical protein